MWFLGGEFRLIVIVYNMVQISWRRQKNTRNSTGLTLISLIFLCFLVYLIFRKSPPKCNTAARTDSGPQDLVAVIQGLRGVDLYAEDGEARGWAAGWAHELHGRAYAPHLHVTIQVRARHGDGGGVVVWVVVQLHQHVQGQRSWWARGDGRGRGRGGRS